VWQSRSFLRIIQRLLQNGDWDDVLAAATLRKRSHVATVFAGGLLEFRKARECVSKEVARGGKARGTYSNELRARTFKTRIECARNDCYNRTIRGLFRHSCWNCRRVQGQCSIQGDTFGEHRQQHRSVLQWECLSQSRRCGVSIGCRSGCLSSTRRWK
jgi:hypothetical protein